MTAYDDLVEMVSEIASNIIREGRVGMLTEFEWSAFKDIMEMSADVYERWCAFHGVREDDDMLYLIMMHVERPLNVATYGVTIPGDHRHGRIS